MPDTETEMNADQQASDEVANDVQQELMDMIIADQSPSEISDKIKDMLFAKSAEKVDSYRPEVAKSTFGDEQAATAAVANAAAAISGETAAAQDAQAEE
mgnify:FL=1|tara:strand:- start:3351 stop:3647 length:297 start_codon:yes stop_codon:yes gene_type:complete